MSIELLGYVFFQFFNFFFVRNTIYLCYISQIGPLRYAVNNHYLYTDISFTVIQIIYYSLYLFTILITKKKQYECVYYIIIMYTYHANILCQLHNNFVVIYRLQTDRFEQNLMSCYLLTRFSILWFNNFTVSV